MAERQYTALGHRIQALRAARGWPPSGLALRVDISVTSLYSIEQGRARPGLDLLARIATVLGADERELARLAGHTLAE